MSGGMVGSVASIMAATALMSMGNSSYGVGRRKKGKAPLTTAQKKVRAKNKLARKARKKK